MKLKLIPEWRKWWRMFSMQAFGWIGSITLGYAALPPRMQDGVPVWLFLSVIGALAVAGAIGRLIDQPAVSANPTKPQQ